jgi:predicted nucleic acid-binding protein
MSDKIFIDTNLLIYSCSDNQIKKDIASNILLSHSELHLSIQVISEFLAVATNKLKMSVDEAISNAKIFMGVYITHSIHTTTVINSFKIINPFK